MQGPFPFHDSTIVTKPASDRPSFLDSKSACSNRMNLIHVLQIKPGVERPDKDTQIGQLQLSHTSADVSLILINAKNRESQAVFLQHRRIQGNGKLLIKEDGVSTSLDLYRERGCSRRGLKIFKLKKSSLAREMKLSLFLKRRL